MRKNNPAVASADDFVINVVYAADKKFLPHLATSIVSLLETNLESLGRLFVIGEFGSTIGFRLFQFWVKLRYGVRLEVFRPINTPIGSLFTSRDITIAAYYRLLIGDIIPRDVARVLYLDADTIVLKSLGELKHLNQAKEASTATVLWGTVSEQPMPHLLGQLGKNSSTFNSGVLLVELDRWRNTVSTEHLLKFARDKGEALHFHDQDVLNLVFANQWGHLPSRFNRMRPTEVLEEDGIIHFVGSEKPWKAQGRKHPYARQYSYFRRRTTFYPYLFEGIGRYLTNTHIISPLKRLLDPHYNAIRLRLERLSFLDERISKVRFLKFRRRRVSRS